MCVSNDSAWRRSQGDEIAMKQTISVLLNNRFNDAERVIGLFSATGYKIEKMVLTNSDANLSKLIVVTDFGEKNVANFLIRLRQQVRVSTVDCAAGDKLPDRQADYAVL